MGREGGDKGWGVAEDPSTESLQWVWHSLVPQASTCQLNAALDARRCCVWHVQRQCSAHLRTHPSCVVFGT
eukprot:177787-Chlamydomonas_euryale.AAC.8